MAWPHVNNRTLESLGWELLNAYGDVERAAARLGLEGRTLQRRLADAESTLEADHCITAADLMRDTLRKAARQG